MKVILELLGDTARILDSVERLGDFRPEARGRVEELLEQLQLESERILATADSESGDESGRNRFMRKALEAISGKKLDVARGILEDAVCEFPEDFEFLNYLGLVCWEQGELCEAESAYHRAVQVAFEGSLDENRVDGADDPVLRAVEGRALALYRLDELDRALECFDWLGSHFPSNYVGCRYLAGEIHHLKGNYREAINRYEDVPVEPSVLYNLGLAHFQRHALEEAVRNWIRGFVANVHIASTLLGRRESRPGCTPGYLGSEDYAGEFADACMRLWHTAEGSLRFLQRCFDHDGVQRHLERCSDRGGPALLQSGEGATGCAGWLERLQDETQLGELSRQVVRRLRV